MKIIKRFFLYLLVLLLIFIIAAFSLAYLYEDKIKTYAFEQINNTIKAQIDVEKIDLTFIKQFPKASLDFHNVKIYDSKQESSKENIVMEAQNIFLSFDIIELINNNYNLQNIVIKDARVNFRIDKKGNHNFNLFNSSSQDSSDFLLYLTKLEFINTNFDYVNMATKQSFNTLITSADAVGIFSKENFHIELKGNTFLNNFYNHSRLIVSKKTIDLDVSTEFDVSKQHYTLQKGILTFDGIPLSLSGDIKSYNNSLGINAKLSAKMLKANKIINNIPSEQRNKIKKYNINGLIAIDATISGKIGGKHKPHLSVYAIMDNFSFDYQEKQLEFNDVSLRLKYNNGKRNSLKTSSVIINKLSGKSNTGDFNGDIKITNLWQPSIKAHINGTWALEGLKKLISIDTIAVMNGVATTNTWLRTKLIYNDKDSSWSSQQLNIDNNFEISDASFAFADSEIQYSNINGKGRLLNNMLSVNQLSAKANNSSVLISAIIKNLPILKFNKHNEKLKISASLKADNLSYELIQKILPKSKSTDSRFSNNIYIAINIETDIFKYENIIAKNLSCKFEMKNRRLSFYNVKLNSLGGDYKGSLWIDGSKQGKYNLYINGQLHNIDIQRTFSTFNNFGQESFKAENINGNITSTFEYRCLFNTQWEINKPSIVLSSEMKITNGALTDLKALNALKSYTKIDDFSNINFSTITNSINIKDSKISIPEMEVHSDKMNINVSGIHNFDNKYEYHFTILLSEVMGNKYDQSLQSEFGEIENDGYGRTKLFLTLTGQGDNFDVKYDRSGLSKKLKQDLNEEKGSLKDALNKEFGWFKTEEQKTELQKKTEIKSDSISSKKALRKKEKEDLKRQEEGEFIIELDDDF